MLGIGIVVFPEVFVGEGIGDMIGDTSFGITGNGAHFSVCRNTVYFIEVVVAVEASPGRSDIIEFVNRLNFGSSG